MNLTKNKIIYTYTIILAIFIVISMASLIVFYFVNLKKNTIQSGVYIKDVNVSGLTKEQAVNQVENYLKEVMSDHIILNYKENEYYVGVEQIEASFNINSAVEYAYQIGKSKNIFKDIKDIIEIYFFNITIDPILNYNEEELEKYIDNIQANLPDQLEQSSYYVENNNLYITSGKIGAGIYKDDLKLKILDGLQTINYNNQKIEIPTYEQYPDEINLQQIHSEIYKEVKNAYYTKQPYAVYPHVVGINFDIEKAQQMIDSEEKEEYKIALQLTNPEVSINDIGLDAFPDMLAEFTTKYDAGAKNRTTNLRLASDKINGTVIMPGEVFSYNKVVGKRTIEAGYKEATIYENGQVTTGLGGGICQISTTLYNAVVAANLEITSRRNHMFTTSYVPAGKDATVAWGSTDFKFKNTRDYPIKIESTVSGGIAKVRVYGLKTDNEYNITIETATVKSTSKNLIVDSFKVYRQNGQVIKKEKISRDTYKKLN